MRGRTRMAFRLQTGVSALQNGWRGTHSCLPVLALLAIGLVTAPGCSDGRPKRFVVTGVITYRGKPVEGAWVQFYPKGARPASGETDAHGRFTLLTFDPGDGAVLGEHTVCVSKDVLDPDDKNPEPLRKHIHVLPTAYATPMTSPLRATVIADRPNDFPFDLVDTPGG